MKKNIKIAVTGANGFVGKHLCNYLAENNYDVVAVVRADSKKFRNSVTVKILPNWDCSNGSNVFDGCDVVIHLVGRAHILNDTVEDPLTEFRKVNVDNAHAVMRKAADAAVQRIIFVSSIGVNGNQTGCRKFVETDLECPHDAYSVSKLEAEVLVREKALQYGMEYVIVRPALIFGPDAPGNFGALLRLAAINVPVPFQNIKARRNILSIWNMINFLEICAMHPAAANEIFLIADEQEIMLPEIFKYLRIGMNRNPRIWRGANIAIRVIATLMRKKRAFAKINSDLRVDISKAKSLLNWSPVYNSFEALKKTGNEYIERKQ